MIGLELIVKLKKMEFKEVANYLDVSPQSVSDWIKEKRKVPERRAEQLSELFNVKKELIGKILTEEEKLKLHYELTDFSEVVSNSDNYGEEAEKMEQLTLTIVENVGRDVVEKEEKIFTTSDLEKKVKDERRKIKIQEADIMISQLLEMYKERKAIDIHPEFQRVFRWTNKQRSRFIESILLGIPIPPIFVAEDSNLDGELFWDVIDGVQRLSTVFEFLGVLIDEKGKTQKPTVLVGTKILEELNGKVWNNEVYEHKFSFDQSKYLKNQFLNATLKIIKIDEQSDPKVKYDTFDRLNTGGTRLTEQEIRNCLAIMLNRNFYIWLRQLSYNPNFVGCMPLTEKAKNEQDDMEYVLRFMVYRNIKQEDISSSDDIGELLTERMRSFCTENTLNFSKEKEIFDKTFKLLYDSIGEDSFKKYHQDGKFKGAVNISNFEIIAIGIANNLDEILELENPIEHLREKIKGVYSDPRYIELQKAKIASQRAVTRFNKLTIFGTEYFKV